LKFLSVSLQVYYRNFKFKAHANFGIGALVDRTTGSASGLACRFSARRENEMRIFLAILIALAVVYFFDAEYNQGKLFDGVQSMGRAMSHSMGF
jgi:hypothetical protein